MVLEALPEYPQIFSCRSLKHLVGFHSAAIGYFIRQFPRTDDGQKKQVLHLLLRVLAKTLACLAGSRNLLYRDSRAMDWG